MNLTWQEIADGLPTEPGEYVFKNIYSFESIIVYFFNMGGGLFRQGNVTISPDFLLNNFTHYLEIPILQPKE